MHIVKWFKKEQKTLAAALFLGFIFTVCLGLYTRGYSNDIQAGIADEVIRFHVLANSNTESDQTLKTIVRDAVLDEYRQGLSIADNKEATRAFLVQNIHNIQNTATKTVKANGYDYDVKVCMANDYFPTKAYGDIALPAGTYETLRIEIGQAEGNNWWCIMFPPLCYVDVAKSEIPAEEKEMVKNLLTDQEYELVSQSVNGDNIPVKIKFKIVELWQEWTKDKEKTELINDSYILADAPDEDKANETSEGLAVEEQ